MNFHVLTAILLGFFSSLLAQATDPALSITADFPGANIKVMEQDDERFVLAPDLRDTQAGKWWFYWNFKLHDPAGATAGRIGPSLSVDSRR